MNEVIKIKNLNKIYKLYDDKKSRLKEALDIFHKRKYHRDFYALNNINLSIKKGEIVGLLGKNGAGKSTLLKVITGVLSKTSGELIVDGKISALIELGAGFNPEYTGYENIYLYGTLMGYTKEEIDTKIGSVIKFADIGDFINQPVKVYSSGMFARLAFSCSINVDPDILIVDEILAVGDMRFQMKCINKMKEMMKNGVTILFVSHDVNSIKRFCTRAVWLKNGKIELDGDVNNVTDRYLDFLKFEDSAEQLTDDEELKHTIDDINIRNIAEIKSFKVMKDDGIESDKFRKYEVLKIRVVYTVYDENIEEPVLGIAIKSIENKYICGLNTLLDRKKIPWKKGENSYCLIYYMGVLAFGGMYYFDCALFDSTATVPIQYISKIKEFMIESNYDGEGTFMIPHIWADNFEEIKQTGGENYDNRK